MLRPALCPCPCQRYLGLHTAGQSHGRLVASWHPPVQMYSASLMARVASDLMREATAGGAAAAAAARLADSAAGLEKSSGAPRDSQRASTCGVQGMEAEAARSRRAVGEVLWCRHARGRVH